MIQMKDYFSPWVNTAWQSICSARQRRIEFLVPGLDRMSRRIPNNFLLYQQVRHQALCAAAKGYVRCVLIDPFLRSSRGVRVRVSLDPGGTILQFETEPGLLLGAQGPCTLQQHTLPDSSKVQVCLGHTPQEFIGSESVAPRWKIADSAMTVTYSRRALVFIEQVSVRLSKQKSETFSLNSACCADYSVDWHATDQKLQRL